MGLSIRHWLLGGLLIILGGFSLSGCSLQDLQLLKSKAGLQVVTGESQISSLFLNGDYLDKSPYINKNIKPGLYTLKIEPTDKTLAAFETQITLSEGTLTVITWNPGQTPETSGGVIYELFPNQALGQNQAELEFVTIPDTAIITVDNQAQTFSPLTLSGVEPGNHEFEVKLPSYVTQKHTLNAVAGKKLQITIKLAKQETGVTTSGEATVTPTASPSSPVVNPASAASSSAINQASLSAKINANSATGSGTGTKVLIQSTNYFQDQKEVLRVRAEANAQAASLGWAEVGQSYAYLGDHTDGWYRITLSETISGWVSDQYAQLN